MKLEIVILGITCFFIYNTYHDGKYTKLLLEYKKYYKMTFYLMIGLGIYLLLKKNPIKGRTMLQQANQMIKYIPIDRESRSFIHPILDYTTSSSSSSSFERHPTMVGSQIKNTNTNTNTKRSVSETKKKYVASRQNWKCNECGEQLNHTFEIDHRVRLEYGGSNDVQNLVALCRNCHGIKTANENM